MTPWLLKLRKIPLVGWLVGLIAVLLAALAWSIRSASFREKQLRVSMQISSAKKAHERALDKVDVENKLARSRLMALEAAEVGKLQERRKEIRKAAKESNERLASMVNEMFKKCLRYFSYCSLLNQKALGMTDL